MKPGTKKTTKNEQRLFQLIKAAEMAKQEWTIGGLADAIGCSRSNAQFIVQKLQLKGLLKEGHREIVKHDLITVDQPATIDQAA